jgi:hypothetical protein
LFSDRRGGAVFTCFGLGHWCYILATLAAVWAAFLRLRKRDGASRKRALDRWIGLAFGLYIADFFLMPFAYEAIDIEKLPFHACTAMCVMVFLSRRVKALDGFRASFALLGFLSNFVYLLYPAGVMWHRVAPLTYRVIQTLGFHALMSAGCLSALLFEGGLDRWKRHLAVVAGMTLWAMLGNWAYNSEARVYNWFFVVRDPFGILPVEIAPFVMPILNILLFFAAGMAVCKLIREVRHAL